jgi:hypothetical protein
MITIEDLSSDTLLRIFRFVADLGIAKAWSMKRDNYEWMRLLLVCRRFRNVIRANEDSFYETFDACISREMLTCQIESYRRTSSSSKPLTFKMIAPCNSQNEMLYSFLTEVSPRIDQFVIHRNEVPTSRYGHQLILPTAKRIEMHRAILYSQLSFPLAVNITSLWLTMCEVKWGRMGLFKMLQSMLKLKYLNLGEMEYVRHAEEALPVTHTIQLPNLEMLSIDVSLTQHEDLLSALCNEGSVHSIQLLKVISFPRRLTDKRRCFTRAKTVLGFTDSPITLWMDSRGHRILQGPCPLQQETDRALIVPPLEKWLGQT